ncbi:MAG: DNA-3-methyladenine glycosylase 2 family protein [Pseudomonadota bacterium]|nr:DNA-3-methyladenine glycosylase 2 family protein [Pseudomonadota bacterium]
MSDMQYKLFEDAGHGEGGALDALAARDPDIARTLAAYGPPPDRSLPATYDTLARAIVGQQVSRVAATAIMKRMQAQGLTSVETVAARTPDEMMSAGLSRRKAEYLIGIAGDIVRGRLDISSLSNMPGQAVQDRLVSLRGVGAWTADNFRLFALADMDAWPANDVALQEAMRRLKRLEARPKQAEMEDLALPWRPYRGAGALVLWHLYAIEVRKAAIADI